MAAAEDPLLASCSPATTTPDAPAPGTPEVETESTISSPPSPTKTTEETDLFSTEDPKKGEVLFAWSRFPQFDNTVMVRKVTVTIGLMLVCEALSSVNMINSGFLAVHFTGRNITGAVYGLVGSGVGIGYMVSPFLNSFGRLYHDRGVPIHVILQGLMVVYVVKCAAYAFSDYIVHDVIFSVISVAVRVFTGMLSYLWCMCLVEGVRCWLPDHFQLVNSLVFGTAGYIGYAIGSFVGTFCYELLGFHAPYLVIGVYCIIVLIFSCMILPRDRNPISSFHRLQEEKSVSTCTSSEDGLEVFPCDELSPLVGLPILGQTLVNIAGGYMVVVTVPFLMECCQVSATQASSIVTAYSVVLAAGYFFAGVISQHQLLSRGTQAIIGGLLVTLGLLLMYPSPTLPVLYYNSHYVGYLAIMLVGLGDPFVVSVTISSMEAVQTDLCKRSLSAKQRSKISSLWLMGWLFGYYFGMFLAGVFLDTVPFQLGAWIVATASLAGVGVFAATKLVEVCMKRRQPEKVAPEEVMAVKGLPGI